METGKQPLRDVKVIRSLADALGVAPQVLGLADTPQRNVDTPDCGTIVWQTRMPAEETDPMRRRTLLAGLAGVAGTTVFDPVPTSAVAAESSLAPALNGLLNPPPFTGRPEPLARLHGQAVAARTTFGYGRYRELVARLPGLVSTALATRAEQTTGDEIAAVNRHLSVLYTLASELMIKLGHDRLAWTSADRAVQAAQLGGDVLTEAEARRAWAIVLRRAGDVDTAQRLVADTAAGLQPELNRSPAHRSVYASLLATAAYTAAGNGDRGTASTLIAEATDAAGRVGADGGNRRTSFGPTAVGLYQISIARVLGDAGIAVETARRLDRTAIPTAEQRARHWADVARAYHQWGKPEPCYRALLAAERAAPDEVRYRKPIQRITASLVRNPGANTLPGLRAFATRTGVSL